ncbi:tetraspanin family domain-containing protein [Ditylenchus destructor]|uniref:Tetraspanin family domain-containing protein n=1 Tax=Ditylenchus destructor TaxID=166010 RepID=A0AAD4NJN6_9BILA|nr:tetraspanin family domain-containing protein [Ditylenchus destructor]
MVYGCGNQLIKFFVFVTNLLIFVFGALVFGFSLWANLDEDFAKHLRELAVQAKIDSGFVEDLAQYQASLWVLCAVGALLFVVGFLGCCGAACESLIMLTLFTIVIVILSAIELFTLVVLFTNRGDLLLKLHEILDVSSQTPEGRRNLLPLEQGFHCCGATQSTQQQYQCPAELQNAPDCYSVISSKMETGAETMVGIGVILLIVQAFSIIFSCVLCRAFRERGPAYYA